MPNDPLSAVAVEADLTRRVAAEALFEAMLEGRFDLDLASIDRLNMPTLACGRGTLDFATPKLSSHVRTKGKD